jgi:hypothetical protein
VGLPVREASFSAADPSSSAPADQPATRSVPARPQVQALLAAFQQDAGPCIPRAPRPQALRVAVRALVRVPVVPGAVPALASDPVALLGPAADSCRLPAKHHVRSVRVARHAAVDASSIQRPKKAR